MAYSPYLISRVCYPVSEGTQKDIQSDIMQVSSLEGPVERIPTKVIRPQINMCLQ